MSNAQANDAIVKENLRDLHERYTQRRLAGHPDEQLLSELLEEIDEWAKEPYDHG